MGSIFLAAAFFLGIHLFLSGTSLRDRLVARMGERAYLGLFSVLSLAGIVWLCYAWAQAPPAPPLWQSGELRGVAHIWMLTAFLFAVVGLTTPSPTAVGGEARLEGSEPAQGILRITRHPFLWGVALWAAYHVLVNPDPPSLVFFGSFGALALAGTRSIDAKRRAKHGERWDRFEAVTSNVPFGAIASGRNRLAQGELPAWRLSLALVLYVTMLLLHPTLFGVSAL